MKILHRDGDGSCDHSALLKYYQKLTGEVLRVIRALAEKRTTMIIVTHEMTFARDVADQLIFMDGGVIVEQGDPHQVIDHPRMERTRQFLAHYSET